MQYCCQPHRQKTIMISISDINEIYMREPRATAENGVLEILPLRFADADAPGKDIYGRETSEEDLISREDALMICAFLNRHPDADVIVHCDAGVSRSAGVGAAIMKWAAGSDFAIFDNPRYKPNMRCYRMVLTALMEQ